jgi:hypothetical protein
MTWKEAISPPRELRMPTQWEIDFAKNEADGQYVRNGETWDDYKKRKW